METFSVTVYYDGESIETRPVSDFGYAASEDLEFEWDTTGVELGEYVISANATVVEGEETTADNSFTRSGTIEVVAFEAQTLSAGFFVVPVVVVVIAAAAILLYRRRQRFPEV